MENLMATFLKRRQFLIHKSFQFKLMFISFSYIFFFVAIMSMYMFIPLMMELDKSVRGSDSALEAAERLLFLHETFWPALLLAFFAIGCHSIFISHRIAGPLYRFNLLFKSVKEGVLPAPVKLRTGDYLYREMEGINGMLEQLRGRLTDLQEAQAQLNRSIMKCKDTLSHSSTDELVQKMEDLAEQGKKVEQKLGFFKVS
jgi:methyl-accepting chemotaxis protein